MNKQSVYAFAGGGFAGGLVSGGAVGAIAGNMSGGDPIRGAFYGAMAGGIAFGNPNLELFGSSATNELACLGNSLFNTGLSGAGFGGIQAGMTGGNIAQGAAKGALAWAAGESANILIGHSVGYIMSGKGPEFNDGAFYYYAKGQGPFTVGGVIVGDKAELNRYAIINGQRDPRYTVAQHEKAHFSQQTILSVSYIPIHLISQSISGILSGFDFQYGTHKYNIFERWLIDVPSY